ncbi:MAG TPA: hypothetical protein VFK85_10900, partial [Anaeromyxobacteraceae bacterium]|nr:hypothetical protein [Anaeromyxobacteraceae bacterium]
DALEEHHAAKVTSAELDAMPADGERFAAKMKVLATSVRAHIEEEERQLLPELERLLDAEELQDLGAALEMAKRVAPTHPHPTAPDSPPGGIVANAAAGIMDRARDALRGGVEVVRFLARRGAESAFRGARDAIARGQRQAARTGAEVRQTGREGIAQARAAGRQAVAEIGNGREHGSRTLQQSARGAAALLELSERRQARGGTTAQRQPKRGRGGRGGSKKQRAAAQRRPQSESRTVMH